MDSKNPMIPILAILQGMKISDALELLESVRFVILHDSKVVELTPEVQKSLG